MTKQYITRTLHSHYKKRKIARMVGQGWEIVADNLGTAWNRRTMLRKPNPRYAGSKSEKRALARAER